MSNWDYFGVNTDKVLPFEFYFQTRRRDELGESKRRRRRSLKLLSHAVVDGTSSYSSDVIVFE